ncbi:MAG: AmmeMemoRadiSam system protein B [Candidatus Omnitrophica bacterium]|nr:AmmeMemoRadiSam system protein B [Candidatus Omnitrophota bacterium]
MVRRPVVAGQFYPGTKELLLKTIASTINKLPGKDEAIGVISPHAGYIYSGSVAGAVLSSIKPRPKYIILGPNHTGLGVSFSMSKASSWKTPLGDVTVDEDLRKKLLMYSGLIEADDAAHIAEHSIEVQLPILQAIQKKFTFVPIVVASDDLQSYRMMGKDIAGAIKELGIEKEVLIIASSDMTHYESDESVRRKDKAAIEAILELDEEKLFKRIRQMDISMCGYGPTAIMISAAKILGAKTARLVKYQTSGDASGDYSSVVGYAGITVS